MSYCGTADCILVSRDWTDLTTSGTTSYADDYITDASAWADAEVNDWHGPVNPLTSGGSTYDYWIRKAVANRAVWMAYDSVMRDKYEVVDEGYWNSYRDTAQTIMDNLRKRHSVMTEDTSTWERGIAPAEGVANGTVTAPYVGVMISNAEHSGVYTGEMPRTYTVELDGTGTSIYGQSFRWKPKGGTAWTQEGVSIQPDTWHGLEGGVSVSWLTQANEAVAVEQMWEVACFPARGGNYKTSGLNSWSMVIG